MNEDKISTNGTENHIALCVVRDKGVTGSKVELVCEHADISINKNTVYGDTSPMNPGGIRLGSSAMTTRKLKEEDFKKIAIFIDRAVKIAIDIQNKNGKKLVDFKKGIELNNDIISLKKEVNEFSENLYFPTNMDEFN